MAERVFLHIGAPKTGTTYAQEAMWHNRDRLREQGVLYPGRVRMDHYFATLTVRELSFGDHRPLRARTAWARLIEEAGSWDGTAIISHEFFGAASTDQAQRAIEALAPAEVHLIVTARDYVRQVPAYWQQSVKSAHYSDGLGEYVRATLADELGGPWSWLTMDTVAVLSRWAKHVSPERVHLVTVPQSGAPRELFWQRYASVIGIDPDSCDLSRVRPNTSLGVVEAELLRRIKPKIPAPITDQTQLYRWQRGYLAHELLVPRGGERFGLRPERAATLRDLSRAAADDLAAAGYDVVGDLGELVPPADLPVLRHPEDASDADLLDAATDTIGLMLRDVRLATLRAEKAERAAGEATARLAALEREGGPRRHFGVKRTLIDLSERHSLIRRLRVLYWKTANAVRRRRRT